MQLVFFHLLYEGQTDATSDVTATSGYRFHKQQPEDSLSTSIRKSSWDSDKHIREFT